MANTNKYAELPGFAVDQPDVFETSDLPESDQNNLEGFGDQSETVEKVSISTSEAYEKFRDQKLDASGVDFTDSIKKTKHSGYAVTSGDWELIGSGSPENETLQQRYQRLKHETTELFEEIDKLKQSSKSENEGGISITDISKNVESLQHQILDLNLHKVLGSELIANISDPHGVLQKKLITEIGTFKPTDAKTSKVSQPKGGANEDFIKYNLLYKPTDSQTGISAKATDLEGRIKKLEALLGNDDKKLTLLTPQGQARSLLASVDFLSSRLGLLDPGNLEKVEARLSYLNQHLQQIAEKKSQLDLEKQNKVSELYDLAKKTESMSNSLPKVLERLDSLQQLHEQAMQFSQALTQLDNVQQQILITLKNDEKMMKEAQESFAKNSEMITRNVAFLDERIAKLEPN